MLQNGCNLWFSALVNVNACMQHRAEQNNSTSEKKNFLITNLTTLHVQNYLFPKIASKTCLFVCSIQHDTAAASAAQIAFHSQPNVTLCRLNN